MSMRDLGILAERLITEFPEYYPYFAMTEFNYKDRAPANSQNRNPLLRIAGSDWTADGLKTGRTEEAGFGLVGSARLGDRRVVFVISGLASDKDRAEEGEALANWAFRQFVSRTLARTTTRVAEAEVFLGASGTVGLVPQEDVTVLLPALVQDGVTAEVIYDGPLLAPVEAGTAVAELVIRVPGLPERRVPLLAETAVAPGGFVSRLGAAAAALRLRFAGAASPAT